MVVHAANIAEMNRAQLALFRKMTDYSTDFPNRFFNSEKDAFYRCSPLGKARRAIARTCLLRRTAHPHSLKPCLRACFAADNCFSCLLRLT